MSLMRTVSLLLCLGALASGQIINEFSYDDTSTDDFEFVEIFNNTPNPILPGAISIENVDNGGISLMGVVTNSGTIPPGGFWVFGNVAWGAIANDVIPTNSLENDMEVIILRDVVTGTVLDTATYEANKQTAGFPFALIEGQGIWGNFTSPDAAPQSWARYADGLDTNDNGADFGLLPATPGATNNIAINLIPFTESFNGFGAESPVPNFSWSFVPAMAVDPTVMSAHNPTVIPASPGGGNCMTLMDPTGGGDAVTFVSTPVADMSFEAWVYFQTGALGGATQEIESWSIGIRGTGDTFHNHPDPNFLGGANANGNTGICWTYIYDALGGTGTLYLRDEGNGGADEINLASYVIMPGVNDGWQRLRLSAAGDVIDANFGGTIGNPASGLRTKALTTTTGIGCFYFGYREFLVSNANMRPVSIDDLTILVGTAPYSVFLTQNTPGFIGVENRGLVGVETWNIFSLETCPGGVGTGPYLGLCTVNLQGLLDQYFTPVGALPFHFLPAGASNTFGPIPLPMGLHIEVVSLDLLGNISTVDVIDVL